MPERDGQEALPVSLVWIDSQTAVHLRWDGAVSLQRIHSEVPPHHHAMGHLRIDPLTRHGGGGPVEDRVEGARQEKLRRYLQTVAERIPPGDTVWILGPGTVGEQLERMIREDDRRRHRQREIHTRRAGPMTERQLLATLRELAGDPPPRGFPPAG
jgi:hypothetical protein